MTIYYKNLSLNEVDEETKNKMYSLFTKYFICDKSNFFEDLSKKNIITLLLEKKTDEIVGFSTNEYSYHNFNNGIVSLFPGNTIVDKKYRNEAALINSFLDICKFLLEKYPNNKIYWHLISMGYKTYKYLPLFFINFYPNYKEQTPPEIQKILDFLCFERFSNYYNPNTGIVAFPHSEKLRPEYAEVPDNFKKNKHIEFFLKKNPGYIHGHELCCIAEISLDNVKNIPKKILMELLKK